MTPAALLLLLLFLFAGCGDNNDTVLTGFSGVLIFGVVAYVIYRYAKNRSK